MPEVKYIDPTYMIRAIKPNANDSASYGPWWLLWVSEAAMSGGHGSNLSCFGFFEQHKWR